MQNEILKTIEQQISDYPIILYMKGSPQAPQCGFSAQIVMALSACGQEFAFVDVLSQPEIRKWLPQYGNWPTFPQLWVNGELIGGCDLVSELHERNELKPLLEATAKDGNKDNNPESS